MSDPQPASDPRLDPALADDPTARAFLDETLTREQWTHEAHVRVAHHLVSVLGHREALARLQELIPALNARIGTTPGGLGYHETLTRYYVAAVAHAGAVPVETVLADPTCSRTAPARHWSSDALWTEAARRGWAEPDLAPLPWPAGPDGPVFTDAGTGAEA